MEISVCASNCSVKRSRRIFVIAFERSEPLIERSSACPVSVLICRRSALSRLRSSLTSGASAGCPSPGGSPSCSRRALTSLKRGRSCTEIFNRSRMSESTSALISVSAASSLPFNSTLAARASSRFCASAIFLSAPPSGMLAPWEAASWAMALPLPGGTEMHTTKNRASKAIKEKTREIRGKVHPSTGEEQSSRTIVPDLAKRKNALANEPGPRRRRTGLTRDKPRDRGHERKIPFAGHDPGVIHSNPQDEITPSARNS